MIDIFNPEQATHYAPYADRLFGFIYGCLFCLVISLFGKIRAKILALPTVPVVPGKVVRITNNPRVEATVFDADGNVVYRHLSK